KVDLILEAAPDLFTQLEAGEDPGAARRPALTIHARRDDDRARLALRRLTPLLERWKNDLKKVRLVRRGLTEQFLDPFEVVRPEESEGIGAAKDNVADMVVRIFPFMLVMWTLAGALYPAVDLCAGEKERGTMETLLISPASRQEIVWGKFLTIWVFSAATALLNLASMGLTASYFSGLLTRHVLGPAAVLWCVLLALPLSAFFSALCLAMGAYA